MDKSSNSVESQPKIFLTKVIGGKVFQSVVEKEGLGDTLLKSSGYSLLAEGENLGRVKSRITIECPVCGCSKEQFEETGRFGCPDCYQSFGPFLPPILRKMHVGLRHIGKIPRGKLTRELLEERVSHLSDDLAAAVEREDFEAAARLRDQIETLRALPVSGQ